ncbi:MAG: hypothetical protein ACK47C_16680 [Paracoccaceae bacterium]
MRSGLALPRSASRIRDIGQKRAGLGKGRRFWSGKTGHGILNVKACENAGVSMIRDLNGVIEREIAGISVFLTLTVPTKPMITEAASTGLDE